jgi:hypothetical protein
MQDIAEIIANAKNSTCVSSSGPVLEICRKLSGDARFEEIAKILTAWCEYAPHSKRFVIERLPAIVLNTYFVKQDVLTFEQFLKWERANPGWGDLIKDHALSEVQLPAAVSGIVRAMRHFARA